MRIRLTCLLVLAAGLSSCDYLPGLCDVNLENAVVNVRFFANTEKYERDVARLQRLVDRCEPNGTHIENDVVEAISWLEIYVLADRADLLADNIEQLHTLSETEQIELMHTAVGRAEFEFLEILVGAGVAPGALNEVGYNALSPLVYTRKDFNEKFEFLISRGVKPWHEGDGGFSALDAAVMEENAEFTRAVLNVSAREDPRAEQMVSDALEIGRQVDSEVVGLLEEWLSSQQ